MEVGAEAGSTADTMRCTADIVAAFVANHTVAAADIPGIIKNVNAALTTAPDAAVAVAEPAKPLKPAVPVKKSVFPDHIVCLDDGVKVKMLKRHLRVLGMTPDSYRKKWGLPDDYPMVAPDYSAKRSEFAKHIGLGKRGA